jgi:hypothetical protein
MRMGLIHCPETSVNNCHMTPRNTPEDRRFNQHRGGSLKLRHINLLHGKNLLCRCKLCVAVAEILQSKIVVQLFYLKDFTNESSVCYFHVCMTAWVQQQVFSSCSTSESVTFAVATYALNCTLCR